MNKKSEAKEIYDAGKDAGLAALNKKDLQISEMKAAMQAVKDDAYASGILAKIRHDDASNQLMRFVVLKRIKESKEYKAIGMTWQDFCQEQGLNFKTVDRTLADIRPLVETFQDNLSSLAGMDFSKIRMLGRQVSDNMSNVEVTDGILRMDGFETDITDLRGLNDLIQYLKESNDKQIQKRDERIEKLEGEASAKDRAAATKQTTIDKLNNELAQIEKRAAKKGLSPAEDRILKTVDQTKVIFDGMMLDLDPNDMPSDMTAPVAAHYFGLLTYMKNRILAAWGEGKIYEIHDDDGGDADTDFEWTQPHNKPALGDDEDGLDS